MPAWVERGGRVPLAPGMEAAADDELQHRRGARLLLKLADGSTVKLGENAQLCSRTLQVREDSVFEAALNVLAGRVPVHHRRARQVAASAK